MQIQLNKRTNVLIEGYNVNINFYNQKLSVLEVCAILNYFWKCYTLNKHPYLYSGFSMGYKIRIEKNKMKIGCRHFHVYKLYKLTEMLKQLGETIYLPKLSKYELFKMKMHYLFHKKF